MFCLSCCSRSFVFSPHVISFQGVHALLFIVSSAGGSLIPWCFDSFLVEGVAGRCSCHPCCLPILFLVWYQIIPARRLLLMREQLAVLQHRLGGIVTCHVKPAALVLMVSSVLRHRPKVAPLSPTHAVMPAERHHRWLCKVIICSL